MFYNMIYKMFLQEVKIIDNQVVVHELELAIKHVTYKVGMIVINKHYKVCVYVQIFIDFMI